MQGPSSIPPYKPPQQIQDILDKKLKFRQQQLEQQQQQHQQEPQARKRTAVLPKRNWIQRNPRLFQITFITTSLLIFFSKPLYDAFIADPVPATGVRVPPHKR